MTENNGTQLEVAEDHLVGLGERFMKAMRLREAHDVDGAAEILRAILKEEPRLAEPRMELGRLLFDTAQAEEAEEQVREAIRILEAGGQWIEDLEEDALLSTAYSLLGEVLRERSSADELVFGDPEAWRAMTEESRAAFKKALTLDSTNEHAAYWSGGLDVEKDG